LKGEQICIISRPLICAQLRKFVVEWKKEAFL